MEPALNQPGKLQGGSFEEEAGNPWKYVGILLNRTWTIILVFLLVGRAAAVYTLRQQKILYATVSLVIDSITSQVLDAGGRDADGATRNAAKWLEGQLAALKTKLATGEFTLNRFKKRRDLISTSQTITTPAMSGSRILAFGLASQADINDDRQAPAYEIAIHLQGSGAIVAYCDPLLPRMPSIRRSHGSAEAVPCSREAFALSDAAVDSTAPKQFFKADACRNSRPLRVIRNSAAALKPPATTEAGKT